MLNYLINAIEIISKTPERSLKGLEGNSPLFSENFIKEIISNNKLDIIESGEGIFSPDKYFKYVNKIPEELFIFLNKEENYKNIKNSISKNFSIYKIEKSYLEKYPNVFNISLIPINLDIFEKIIKINKDYIFPEEQLTNRFFYDIKRTKKKHLVRKMYERVEFSCIYNFEEEIFGKELKEMLLNPDKIETKTGLLNVLKQLCKKNSLIRETFNSERKRIAKEFSNKKIIHFKNEVIEDFIREYFTSRGVSCFLEELDFGPILFLFNLENEKKEICEFSYLCGNYLNESFEGAVKFLEVTYNTEKEFCHLFKKHFDMEHLENFNELITRKLMEHNRRYSEFTSLFGKFKENMNEKNKLE